MKSGRINPLPIWFGAGLTITVLGCVIWAGLSSVCEPAGVCAARWKLLDNAPANELGDTLSGVGSVLAFVWVIVTVVLQSQELKAQREELRQQRLEWERISKAQDKQVEIMTQQAEIFEDEQKARAEDRANKELKALIDRFLTSFQLLKSTENGGPYFEAIMKLKDEERNLDNVVNAVICFSKRVSGQLPGAAVLAVPRRDEVEPLALDLAEIKAIQPRLSRADQIWLTRFKLIQAAEVLDDLLAQPVLRTDTAEGP